MQTIIKILLKFSVIIILLSVFSSCRSYYVNTADLKTHFSNIDSSQLVKVKIRGTFGETYSYLANPIHVIQGVDNNNNTIKLYTKPTVEVRITEKNRKKTMFYFDRIYLNDSLFYGVQSRISPVNTSIYLKNIKSIQWIDNKKGFNYVN